MTSSVPIDDVIVLPPVEYVNVQRMPLVNLTDTQLFVGFM